MVRSAEEVRNMKITNIEVNFKNKNLPVRTIELGVEDWELIKESVNFYYFNAEKFELEMMDNGSNRMRLSALSLRKNLSDLGEKLYEQR